MHRFEVIPTLNITIPFLGLIFKQKHLLT